VRYSEIDKLSMEILLEGEGKKIRERDNEWERERKGEMYIERMTGRKVVLEKIEDQKLISKE
jgi:hypothetical protein